MSISNGNFDRDPEDREVQYMNRGAITGSILGVLAFLFGIGLLVLVFQLAHTMFTTDPTKYFNVGTGKPLDLSKTAALFMGVVVRVLLLLVMAIVGGLIANRGIHLYADSRHSSKSVVIREKKSRRKRRNVAVEVPTVIGEDRPEGTREKSHVSSHHKDT